MKLISAQETFGNGNTEHSQGRIAVLNEHMWACGVCEYQVFGDCLERWDMIVVLGNESPVLISLL